MAPRVAVVTGANKGIGYAAVSLIAKKFNGIVYLTSRNTKLGDEAFEKIQKEVGAPYADKIRYHQLDITNHQSIVEFRDHLKHHYGGLDILINNAGFAYKMDSKAPFSEQAEVTVNINYFGTKEVCKILFPILKDHARVVNVCGRLGHVTKFGPELKATLTSKEIKISEIDKIMHDFVKSAKEDKHLELGYPATSYGVSKAAEIALSLTQNREFAKHPERDIVVNACCPGNVATDMSSHKGFLTPEEGADTLVYLALLPPNVTSPRGEFVGERKIIDWPNYVFRPEEFMKKN